MRKTHGMTAGKYNAAHYPAVYGVWKNMKQRCLNKNNPAYARYGGKGVRICMRWMKFENFLVDMGHPPKGKTIDRIDSKKGYYPGNCRWATYAQQAVNSSRAKFVRIDGIERCISEWCRYTGITYGVYKARVRAGWSHKKALTTPPKKQRNNRKPIHD